jgi:hypothetical protein
MNAIELTDDDIRTMDPNAWVLIDQNGVGWELIQVYKINGRYLSGETRQRTNLSHKHYRWSPPILRGDIPTCKWIEGPPDINNIRFYTLACGRSLRLTRHDVMQFELCPMCGAPILIQAWDDRPKIQPERGTSLVRESEVNLGS